MPWTGGASTRNSFAPAPEAEVWDQTASTGSSGESFLTGLQIAAFSPRPQRKKKRKEGGNGARISSLAFLLMSTSISPCGPFPHDLIQYNYLLKAPSPNTIMLRIRASTSEFFWEDLGVTKKNQPISIGKLDFIKVKKFALHQRILSKE